MKGDYSRNTFDSKKHYSGVRMQQGRLQLDADWNEQMDILLYRLETEVGDFIGESGVPRELSGGQSFAVGVGGSPDRPALSMAPGRYYVRGRMFESDAVFSLALADLSPAAQAGSYVAYLDTWQSSISATEDPNLREVALGGPDTATRVKNIWRLRLERLEDGQAPAEGWLPAERRGLAGGMALRHQDGAAALGNQLYRVEIHQGGAVGTASFKWSRDNGAVVAQVRSVRGAAVELAAAPRDSYAAFRGRDWVELLTLDLAERGEPGRMVQLNAAAGATFTAAEALGDDDATGAPPYQIVRRWDGAAGVAAISDGWIDLEAGLAVRFQAGDASYHAGDYWLFATRAATQSAEWAASEALQLPHGVRHDYVPLALLRYDDAGAWHVEQDLRRSFWALDKGAVSKQGDTMVGPLTIAPPAGAPALVVQGDAQIAGALRVPDLRVVSPMVPNGLPASAANEPLRIVRGIITSDGTSETGTGFRVERPELPDLAAAQQQLAAVQAEIQQHDAEIARLGVLIAQANAKLKLATDAVSIAQTIRTQLSNLRLDLGTINNELVRLRNTAISIRQNMDGSTASGSEAKSQISSLIYQYTQAREHIVTASQSEATIIAQMTTIDTIRSQVNLDQNLVNQLTSILAISTVARNTIKDSFSNASLDIAIAKFQSCQQNIDTGNAWGTTKGTITNQDLRNFAIAQEATRPAEQAMELLFSQVVGFPEQLTPQISGLNSFIIEGGNQIAALNQQLTDEQRLRTTADGTRTTVAATLTRLQSAATGRYRLVFEPAFSDLPAVTVTPIRSSTDDFYLAVMSDLSTERVDVSIVLQSGKDTSARFAFIAAGLHERG